MLQRTKKVKENRKVGIFFFRQNSWMVALVLVDLYAIPVSWSSPNPIRQSNSPHPRICPLSIRPSLHHKSLSIHNIPCSPCSSLPLSFFSHRLFLPPRIICIQQLFLSHTFNTYTLLSCPSSPQFTSTPCKTQQFSFPRFLTCRILPLKPKNFCWEEISVSKIFSMIMSRIRFSWCLLPNCILVFIHTEIFSFSFIQKSFLFD